MFDAEHWNGYSISIGKIPRFGLLFFGTVTLDKQRNEQGLVQLQLARLTATQLITGKGTQDH
ncbi:MAG: hypothetical protein KJN85_02155 [Maribacter sp.]|nr:hypothetical protein [Maribacter sp.]